jgi:CheY-like chemotaxis protein/anti-sigma regulatory factor (Ser/Thr protein kinase)
MSHELRTPLNGILGMAQMLVQRDLTSLQHGHARTILDSGKVLKALLDDVLDLSKIDAGRMELSPRDHDVRLLLERIRRIWEPQARQKALAFRVRVAEGVPAGLHLDQVRLEQCISNLVSNAVKFTERGEVRLEVSSKDIPGGFILSVAVSDTGAGMGAETAERLFNPFVQADNSISRRFRGSGLGLVITRKLAALMGGGVTIQSKKGEGSTVTLTLTARSAPTARLCRIAAAGRSDPPEAPREASGARRILLVDDHPINRRVGRLFLEPAGYQVWEAENGFEALQKLDEGHFDLMLLDIHMPVLDGLETLKRIRSADKPWRDLPIIALTADAMPGDRERYLAEGMNGYVAKPIEQRDLLAEIARLTRAEHPASPAV